MAGVLSLTEGAAPSTPASGLHALYVATDGVWRVLSDAAVDAALGTSDMTLVTANVTDANITNDKLASMTEATIKGRDDGAGTGAPTDLTNTQVVAMIADEFAVPDGDADWTALTLGSGWLIPGLYPSGHTYVAPGYRKIAGVVYLRGTARKGISSSEIGTLPSGYRPSNDSLYLSHYATSTTLYKQTCWVYANGEIRPGGSNNSTFHLDGIHFVPA